ncbi:MAG: phosphotransferase [bacterium]
MRVPTIFTAEKIAQTLAERYGISDVSGATELAGSSTGHVWKVETGSGSTYILKEFTSTFPLERVAHEPELVVHLHKKGLPVSQYYPTVSGELTWVLEGCPVNLQSFLTGTPAQQCQASPKLLEDSVKLLADIQLAMADYPALAFSMDEDWFVYRKDTVRRQKKLGDLLGLAQALEHDNQYKDQIVSDLEWKLSSLEKAHQMEFDPTRFTYGNTHGDYNVGNLLVNGEEIVGAIDFSNARQLPFVSEVLRSYTLGAPECAEAVIDLENLRQYFGWYQERLSLNEYDLTMAAKLSYFHIVNTGFGYHEYLVEGAENVGSLIGYSSWNVKLAKWYEAHEEEIAEALGSVAR